MDIQIFAVINLIGSSPVRLPTEKKRNTKDIRSKYTSFPTRSDQIPNLNPPQKEIPTALRPRQTFKSDLLLDGARWESS